MKEFHGVAACVVGLIAAIDCNQSQNQNAMSPGAPMDASPPVLQGYMAVQSRQCGKCHQSTNAADGILSGQTTPVPDAEASYGSNLTPDPDTGMDAWDAGDIVQAILGGVGNQGATLCPAMPRWAEKGMGPDEAADIAAYLQSLTPVWHLVPDSKCGNQASAADGGSAREGG